MSADRWHPFFDSHCSYNVEHRIILRLNWFFSWKTGIQISFAFPMFIVKSVLVGSAWNDYWILKHSNFGVFKMAEGRFGLWGSISHKTWAGLLLGLVLGLGDTEGFRLVKTALVFLMVLLWRASQRIETTLKIFFWNKLMNEEDNWREAAEPGHLGNSHYMKLLWYMYNYSVIKFHKSWTLVEYSNSKVSHRRVNSLCHGY